MQQKEKAEDFQLLNYLSQPVLFVRSGEIIRRNNAAAALMQPESSRMADYLGDSREFYDTFDGQGVMQLMLQFGGRDYSATVHRADSTDLFIASERPVHGQLSLDTLAVIAQTLRGPLTDLFDVSSFLFPLLEEQENPRIQRQTARLNKGFYQLLRLTSNLSDTGQFLSGEARLYDERTDLLEYFTQLSENIRCYCEAAGIELQFSCPSRRFYGSIDRQKIERAVLNLISNALKFTPRGGRIQLKVETTARSLLIRVTDNGEGMDPPMMATIFSRYEHREQLGDPRWGIGLGLPLVRFIANLHGGTVVVNSAPGSGTSVTMSLALRNRPSGRTVGSPILNYDYAGGYSHVALELSDVLPNDVFDSININ